MRVLIDNCLPVDLRHHLHGHDIETAAYRGWGALENGELVGAAVEAGFEALITVDQGTDMARASRGQAILWDPALAAVVDPGGYPDPGTAATVDEAAVPLAKAVIERRYPGCAVELQHHGNPGFDFLVTNGSSLVRYVELKSTTLASGRFFMSEYQRAFSSRNKAKYSLLVLAALDLANGTCVPHWFDGAVDENFALAAIQWRGLL